MPVLEAQRCAACGTDNSADALFCERCIAPLRIKSLADLDAEDFRLCAGALAETLSFSPGQPEPSDMDDATADLLDAYLHLHWLRPETALWQTLDARAVRNRESEYIRDPILDLGCGDGTHSAVMFGTRFDPCFDVFAALRLNAADIYDAFDPHRYHPRVIRRGRRIGLGIDIRENMVKRAKTLGVYRALRREDATNLSLGDESVSTVFSNVVRDFPDATCRAALGEIARVLKPGGILILPAPTPHWRDSLYFHPSARILQNTGDSLGARRMAELDRGRSSSFAQQISQSEWENRLADCGLEIIDRQATHARQVVRFWDVGFRPFSVPLLHWIGGMDADRRFAVKRSLIATLRPLLVRLLSIVPGNDAAHVVYFVRKK